MEIYTLVSLLVLLSYLPQDSGLEVDDLHNAVVEVYDQNATIGKNVKNIMSFFCPESVYCECQGQSREKCRVMQRTIQDRNTNTMTDTLFSYVEELKGCCTQCYCDESCYDKGNCCKGMPDRFATNTGEYTQRKCISATNEVHSKYKNTNVIVMAESYFMVTACRLDFADENVVSKCNSPRLEIFDEVIPVSSITTGIIYLNKYCAICNNVIETVEWKMLIRFDRKLSFADPEFPISYNDFLNDRMALIFFQPNEDVPVQKQDRCLIKQKSITGRCDRKESKTNNEYFDFLQRACFEEANDTSFSSYFLHNSLYKNVFCFLCGLETNVGESTKTRCDFSEIKAFKGMSILLSGEGKHEDSTKLRVVKDVCDCSEWQDYKTKECRPVMCASGQVREGCDCNAVVQYVSGLVLDIRFEIYPIDTDIPRFSNISSWTRKYTNTDLIEKILRKIPSILKSKTSQSIDIDLMAMFLIQRDSIVRYYLVTYIMTKPASDTRIFVNELFNAFLQEKVFMISQVKYGIKLGMVYDLNAHQGFTFITPSLFDIIIPLYERTVPRSRIPELFSKLIICEKLVLSSNETDFLKNYTGERDGLVREMSYVYSERQSIICFDTFLQIFHPESSFGKSMVLNSGDYFVKPLCLIMFQFFRETLYIM